MIKVFGIGNTLLSDDGIGIKVAKYLLENKHMINKNIDIIIGEKDYVNCINNIEEGDEVIIINSTYFNIPPGMITKTSLENFAEAVSGDITSNDIKFLNSLRKKYKKVTGYLIGIEIDKIDYSINLSERLNEKFYDICYSVVRKINEILSKKE